MYVIMSLCVAYKLGLAAFEKFLLEQCDVMMNMSYNVLHLMFHVCVYREAYKKREEIKNLSFPILVYLSIFYINRQSRVFTRVKTVDTRD